MPSPQCKICSHPELIEIEHMIVSGVSLRTIENRYEFSHNIPARHRDNHMAPVEALTGKALEVNESRINLRDMAAKLLIGVEERWDQLRLTPHHMLFFRACDKFSNAILTLARLRNEIQDVNLNVTNNFDMRALRENVLEAIKTGGGSIETIVEAIEGREDESA